MKRLSLEQMDEHRRRLITEFRLEEIAALRQPRLEARRQRAISTAQRALVTGSYLELDRQLGVDDEGA